MLLALQLILVWKEGGAEEGIQTLADWSNTVKRCQSSPAALI
ncbi:MAG: hypothetical protein NWF05_00235 [Candidatus Bathyarchaeota archaeon]|nr:hypothetical protein [Candidatus Bathyarchaeota archaeon]